MVGWVSSHSAAVKRFGGSRGSTGIVRIAWLRRPWLQQASAGHPWPACALSPYYHVFRHVEAVASLDTDTDTGRAPALRGGGGGGGADAVAVAVPHRSQDLDAPKDVDARGSRSSGTGMYHARVLEQDAEPRGEREPLVAAAPHRSRGCCPCSGGPSPKRSCCPCSGSPDPKRGMRGCVKPHSLDCIGRCTSRWQPGLRPFWHLR